MIDALKCSLLKTTIISDHFSHTSVIGMGKMTFLASNIHTGDDRLFSNHLTLTSQYSRYGKTAFLSRFDA